MSRFIRFYAHTLNKAKNS